MRIGRCLAAEGRWSSHRRAWLDRNLEPVHPLYAALVAAADGRFPPSDGAVEVCEPDDSGDLAVVEFAGHSFVLTSHDPGEVIARGADGYGGATHPDLLRWLA